MLGAGLARATKDQKDANRYQLAEHIILHIRNYPADPSIPSNHRGLDNTRLWQVMSKNKQAEMLLLAKTYGNLGQAPLLSGQRSPDYLTPGDG